MSPDGGSFHFDDPQSLNRFAFTRNNPLRFVDPDGNDPIDSQLLQHLLNFNAWAGPIAAAQAQSVVAGVKAGLAVVGTEAAIAGVVVAAPAVATASTSAYVQASTALSAAGTAIGNAARSAYNGVISAAQATRSGAFQLAVRIDTLKSGGGAFKAAGDFVQGLTSQSRPPANNIYGQVGRAIKTAYTLNKYLSQ